MYRSVAAALLVLAMGAPTVARAERSTLPDIGEFCRAFAQGDPYPVGTLIMRPSGALKSVRPDGLLQFEYRELNSSSAQGRYTSYSWALKIEGGRRETIVHARAIAQITLRYLGPTDSGDRMALLESSPAVDSLGAAIWHAVEAQSDAMMPPSPPAVGEPSAPVTAAIVPHDSIPGLDEYVPVDHPASVLFRPPLVFPEGLKSAGLDGFVLAKLLVGPKGAVEQVAIVRSQPPGLFDSAAIGAARATTFAPALRDEKPVRVWVTTPYLFKQPPPTLDTAPKAR